LFAVKIAPPRNPPEFASYEDLVLGAEVLYGLGAGVLGREFMLKDNIVVSE